MSAPKLSLTGKEWHLKNPDPLPADSSFSILLARERGLDLLSDGERKISDPFLFPEMQKAVERINQAVTKKETIGIFGDYDADGITAALQLVYALRRRGIEPVVYLPDRVIEGYGMRKKSIDALKEKQVSLLITVDTGIASHSEISHASSLGIDTIVTDHHRVLHGRPPAYAVIHPLVPREFPNQHLCGAGVAFMLVRALEDGKVWEGIDRDIVLAMIGTVGDLVPLTGENRALVLHGLKRAKSLPRSPLQELIESVVLTPSITSGDIAFRIVPRLNAAGRMAHPDLALRALLEGGEALKKLHTLNDERQDIVRELMMHAESLVDYSQPFLFVASERFTPGTVGLIAGRLTEKTGKPSLAAAPRGAEWTASLRSPELIDVMRCLADADAEPLLKTFGGHAQAAGCTYEKVQEEKLKEVLSRAVRNLTGDRELVPTLGIDREILPGPIALSSVKDLLTLAPFGMKNEEPRFLLRNRTISDLRVVGAEGTHLQCRIGGTKAIGFGLGTLMTSLSPDRNIDAVCRLSVNEWQGRQTVQFFIEDVRPCKES